MSTNFKRAGSPKEIAEAFGLNEGSLANLRCKKQGPRFYKVNRKIIYFYSDVEAWLKQNPFITIDAY